MAKLMLVEDDNNLREIYEARLQAEGYTITSARDGEEALVVAKAEKPDLIISDVMMPKISGFEMLDILRNTEELKHVKVIMLTALGQTDDQQRADRLGADRYLVKSQVTLEDIVKVAHELLGDQPDGDAPAAPAADSQAASPAPVADPTVTASSPTPVVEPPAAEPTTQAVPAAEAQSTAQEEADVEAQIEDFVAGASSDPGGSPTPIADSTASNDSQASDDAETFVAGADPATSATTPVDSQATSSAPAAPAATPAVSVADDKATAHVDTAGLAAPPAPADAEKSPEADEGTVPIANKKVIKPLDNPEKKDIHTLLALEEVAEKSKQGAPGPTAVIATDVEGPAAVELAVPPATETEAPKISTASSGNAGSAAKTDEKPDDPNNIAL